MKQNKYILHAFSILIIISLGYLPGESQIKTDSSPLQQFESVKDAGFDPNVHSRVKMIYDSTDLSGLLVLSKGNVLLAMGDNTRRFMTHSIRKSFLSALYGIYIDRGIIDPLKNLSDLGIDDKNKLSETEKRATILDLLSARSGVYLPAAYSPRSMEENLPERGSHPPGSYWYYNNWDFNTLCTIFENETGIGIFEAFQQEIAIPLGMKDFRLSDGHYRFESEKSDHPAYLFNLSARDMVLFGQLYLQQGMWQRQQIIPKEWVKRSTSKISVDLGRFSNREGYGLLWWVSENYLGHKMYYASGSGGHRIMIFPGDDLVIVTRVNTYEGKNVSQEKIGQIVQIILDSKMEPSVADPRLIPFNPETEKHPTFRMSSSQLENYTGDYQHPFLGIFSIQVENNQPWLYTSIGRFTLFPQSENQFYPEDLETTIEMIPTDDDDKRNKIKPVFDSQRELQKAIFYY